MFKSKVVNLVNKTLCSKIDLIAGVKVIRSCCIGNTSDSDKLLRVYITKTHKNKQKILPIGQSLFLLTLAVPSIILKNDCYLSKTLPLSNEELEKQCINFKVCFLVNEKNLTSFTRNIFDVHMPMYDHLVRYGTSIFARTLVKLFPKYKCDELYCLRNITKLRADFIVEEKEDDKKLSCYGKKYCAIIFSYVHKNLCNIKELQPIQEDSEEEEEQPIQTLVETYVKSLSLDTENLRRC